MSATSWHSSVRPQDKDHNHCLLRLCELELIERERRAYRQIHGMSCIARHFDREILLVLDVRFRILLPVFFAGFAGSIPIANWMLGNFGTICPPDGPCLIPVAPGIMAPSGVVMVGLVLVLRDLVQRGLGLYWAIAAILFCGVLSWMIAPPFLVLASVTAFLD